MAERESVQHIPLKKSTVQTIDGMIQHGSTPRGLRDRDEVLNWVFKRCGLIEW